MTIVILANSVDDYYTCAADQVKSLEKYHSVKFTETSHGYVCDKFEIIPATVDDLLSLDNWMLIKYEGYENHPDCDKILEIYREEIKDRSQ